MLQSVTDAQPGVNQAASTRARRERSKVPYNFLPVSKALLRHPELDPYRLAVVVAISRFWDTRRLTASVPKIATWAGCGVRTARDALQWLERVGAIEPIPGEDNPRGGPKATRVYWLVFADPSRLAGFEAAVPGSQSDAPELQTCNEDGQARRPAQGYWAPLSAIPGTARQVTRREGTGYAAPGAHDSENPSTENSSTGDRNHPQINTNENRAGRPAAAADDGGWESNERREDPERKNAPRSAGGRAPQAESDPKAGEIRKLSLSDLAPLNLDAFNALEGRRWLDAQISRFQVKQSEENLCRQLALRFGVAQVVSCVDAAMALRAKGKLGSLVGFLLRAIETHVPESTAKRAPIEDWDLPPDRAAAMQRIDGWEWPDAEWVKALWSFVRDVLAVNEERTVTYGQLLAEDMARGLLDEQAVAHAILKQQVAWADWARHRIHKLRTKCFPDSGHDATGRDKARKAAEEADALEAALARYGAYRSQSET